MERTDLRMPALALAAWAGGLAGHLLPAWVAGVAVVVGVAVSGLRRSLVLAAATLVLAAVAASALLRQSQLDRAPVAVLADERAQVAAEGVVVGDPRATHGFQEGVAVRVSLREVTGRGTTHRLRAPVLVFGDPAWSDVRLGSRVRLDGRLAPAEGSHEAAVLAATSAPVLVEGPDAWWRGAEAVRASLRASVAHRPDDQRALVPALVVGDDSSLDPRLAEDFRATGLTHLLAVSGTNLTLVVGFLLVLGRWCGVRGRGHYVVGAVGIVGFVLLARTEPSVVRAAAMGAVALVGMGVDGRRRGPRALGVAVVVLLLLDPGLATTVGFALSAVATAGILMVAPGLRDALARWLPRWVAEAVAVPLAAQLACTPLVAAISGQVSLVAVAANLAAAPAVGPATVLGLAGGLGGLLAEPVGRVPGTGAAWSAAWLVEVAERGAALPVPSVGWGTGPVALGLLTILVVGLTLALPPLLRRPATGLGCGCLVAVLVLVRLPVAGWPPDGWVLVACDVGQGDALALRTGPGSAVVVDAGPDPALVDRCLDRLGVEQVPLLVLTHQHADHVDGLAGVEEGREVGQVETDGDAPYAATRVVGEATVQVLWPPPGHEPDNPNDESVVLLVEVDGVTMLLTGDIEPPSQLAVARTWPGLTVDVVKVPHHGSRFQDSGWLLGLGARLAIVSSGADNDYGHPAPETLAALEGGGLEVHRTDLEGDVAVVVEDGGIAVATTR
ncbi:ComEC/Rec2 family competence protein [Nocardioides sp. GXQ0305]|uniref:ComEC/Rec2 family competence protein n=1 Tax=Nocardioides sp. GXQ0305 TaxID=3423912 RepID=UPI003D7DC144